GKDLDSAPAATANAVRLMSIHQSKGLEFPIVVLAGTGNEFNQRELREQVLFDEQFGLCPKVNDPENETRYPSLPYWVAQRREKQFLLEEEMRLLYVAMTRARDYLVLTGGRKRTAEKLLPALAGKECVESPFKAGCMQDWLLDWIWTQTGSDLGNGIGATGLLRWEIGEVEPASPAANVSKADETSELEPPLEEIEIERIERVLEWSYDWPESTKEVAKTNVSELRRRAHDA
ncbi:MAG: 3'-5' exonuclease, partial [Verrucomicrobiia bacterium]